MIFAKSVTKGMKLCEPYLILLKFQDEDLMHAILMQLLKHVNVILMTTLEVKQ